MDDKPVDVSRLDMKVGKIIECIKHPGKMIKKEKSAFNSGWDFFGMNTIVSIRNQISAR